VGFGSSGRSYAGGGRKGRAAHRELRLVIRKQGEGPQGRHRRGGKKNSEEQSSSGRALRRLHLAEPLAPEPRRQRYAPKPGAATPQLPRPCALRRAAPPALRACARSARAGSARAAPAPSPAPAWVRPACSGRLPAPACTRSAPCPPPAARCAAWPASCQRAEPGAATPQLPSPPAPGATRLGPRRAAPPAVRLTLLRPPPWLPHHQSVRPTRLEPPLLGPRRASAVRRFRAVHAPVRARRLLRLPLARARLGRRAARALARAWSRTERRQELAPNA
jgi:hypothetical protein